MKRVGPTTVAEIPICRGLHAANPCNLESPVEQLGTPFD